MSQSTFPRPTRPLARSAEQVGLSELLTALIRHAQSSRARSPCSSKSRPISTTNACADIAELALAHKLDGLIVSNTTTARPANLRSRHANETGGLSGAPLFVRSTAVLRSMRRLTQGKITLVGVGGVSSGADASPRSKPARHSSSFTPPSPTKAPASSRASSANSSNSSTARATTPSTPRSARRSPEPSGRPTARKSCRMCIDSMKRRDFRWHGRWGTLRQPFNGDRNDQPFPVFSFASGVRRPRIVRNNGLRHHNSSRPAASSSRRPAHRAAADGVLRLKSTHSVADTVARIKKSVEGQGHSLLRRH